jgi:sugar lactone lactonase YvrE
MKKALLVILTPLVLLVLYLLVWPVPIDPIVWQPAEPPALDGHYAPNTYLADVERLDLPSGPGPEDVAVDALGRIYGGLQDGRIIRMASDGTSVVTFADTEGRPLGLAFDTAGNLVVADAFKGLLKIAPNGAITVLATEAGGVPFRFTDDVDLGPDGTIYFSDASSKYDQHHYKEDLVESRPNGRLLAYDPITGATRVLLDDLYFANGIAVSPDGAFVLVNETSRYAVRRYWLTGSLRGTSERFIDNLPCFPDGISSNGAGVYWLALVSPRNRLIDKLAPHPFVRSMILRLPDFLQPAPERYAFVLGLDADGRVVHNLQNPSGQPFAIITSVEQVGDMLYLGSLTEPALARIRVPGSRINVQGQGEGN